MINVTGMNHEKFILNADHIEKVEQIPETIITLINGKKYIVLESVEDIKRVVIEYKNKIFTYKI
jgi:flagellar protein FlbD